LRGRLGLSILDGFQLRLQAPAIRLLEVPVVLINRSRLTQLRTEDLTQGAPASYLPILIVHLRIHSVRLFQNPQACLYKNHLVGRNPALADSGVALLLPATKLKVVTQVFKLSGRETFGL
jgi:hypothetical protein